MKTKLLFLLLCVSVAFNGVAQSISVTSINSNPAEVDGDVTLNITYSTDNANDIIYIGMELKNSDGSWAATIAEGFINPVGVSGTDIATSSTITIPATTTPSADLTDGQYYDIKVELNAEAWAGLLAGDYPTITLAASGTLAVKWFSDETFSIYPNPVSEELNIKASNSASQYKSYVITNVLGKIVAKKSNSKNIELINVSSLSKGLYFLQLDSLKPIKFLKQ
ncbi:T9SS type A sorting domain-containing protein [Thalassobellus citreus]|uniref:T9SS type A sorting domain-containing protein n=1 Tax=Thalassobellus citreus TaxID=3367752 RepID=UPI00379DDFE4